MHLIPSSATGEGNMRAAITVAETALTIYEAIEAKAEAEKVRTTLAQWGG